MGALDDDVDRLELDALNVRVGLDEAQSLAAFRVGRENAVLAPQGAADDGVDGRSRFSLMSEAMHWCTSATGGSLSW